MREEKVKDPEEAELSWVARETLQERTKSFLARTYNVVAVGHDS